MCVEFDRRALQRMGGIRRGFAMLVLAVALSGPVSLKVPGASADPKPGGGDLFNETISIEARRLDGFARMSTATSHRYGKLDFRGGLVLTSPSNHFGGWSGLEIDPDGRRILAVSDAGAWLTAELIYEGQRLKGIKGSRIGPILALGGKRLAGERDRDAEGVRLLEGTLAKGSLLIAFEQNHRVGRFEISDKGMSQPTGYVKKAAEWGRMIRNKSMESVAVIRGGPAKGAIVAFAERMIDSSGQHTGWIWPGGIGGDPQRLSLRRIGDFDITDAASLPDGSLVILERSFAWLSGVKMRMRKIAASDVRAGTVFDGDVLIEADMSYELDNMEGLAIHQAKNGESILTLISDNNFNNCLQRTLILQFALAGEKVTAAAPR